MDEKQYLYIKSKVLKLTGLSLDAYKSEQMRRRLDGYISRVEPGGIAIFCRSLDNDPERLQALMDFMTINVSEFFRDSDQFDVLRSKVLPDLLKRTPRLNIWSAGCSVGAEPYSLAMILQDLSPGVSHRILATDLDAGSLSRARAGGPYTANQLEQVGAHERKRYFDQTDEGFVVQPKIRSRVEFKKHDLLQGPIESGFDLILCRNVTIYFTEETKDTLNRGFSESLNEGGVLFIGSTESLLNAKGVGLHRINTAFFQKDSSSAVSAKVSEKDQSGPQVLAA